MKLKTSFDDNEYCVCYKGIKSQFHIGKIFFTFDILTLKFDGVHFMRLGH